MCDVCNAEGLDPLIINGPVKGKKLQVCTLFVFFSSPRRVKLCYIHSIDLFELGEARFARKFPLFSGLVSDKRIY